MRTSTIKNLIISFSGYFQTINSISEFVPDVGRTLHIICDAEYIPGWPGNEKNPPELTEVINITNTRVIDVGSTSDGYDSLKEEQVSALFANPLAYGTMVNTVENAYINGQK